MNINTSIKPENVCRNNLWQLDFSNLSHEAVAKKSHCIRTLSYVKSDYCCALVICFFLYLFSLLTA